MTDHEIEQSIIRSRESRLLESIEDWLFAPCASEKISEPVKETIPKREKRIVYAKRTEL